MCSIRLCELIVQDGIAHISPVHFLVSIHFLVKISFVGTPHLGGRCECHGKMAHHFLHDCFLLASFSFSLPPCACFRLNMELKVSLD